MTRWRPLATTAACVLALGVSVFLTWGHYFDQKAISDSCAAFVHESAGRSGIFNCDAVTTSSQSIIFGIPVAVYGLVYFLAMLALCLPRAWRSSSLRVAQARLALSVAGMGFVLYLVSVEFLELHHVCLYCSGVHLMQFLVFLLVVTGWYDTGYAAAVSRPGGGEDEDDYGELESTPKRRLIDA